MHRLIKLRYYNADPWLRPLANQVISRCSDGEGHHVNHGLGGDESGAIDEDADGCDAIFYGVVHPYKSFLQLIPDFKLQKKRAGM